MSDHHPAMYNEAADLPKWYYRDGKDVFGPYTLNELADFVRQGLIGPEDSIWLSSSPHWVRADRISLLFRLAGCTAETARKQPVRRRGAEIVQSSMASMGLALGRIVSLPAWIVEQLFAFLGDVASSVRLLHVLAITCVLLIGLASWGIPKFWDWMKSPSTETFFLCE